jgi:hypothetical protein
MLEPPSRHEYFSTKNSQLGRVRPLHVQLEAQSDRSRGLGLAIVCDALLQRLRFEAGAGRL